MRVLSQNPPKFLLLGHAFEARGEAAAAGAAAAAAARPAAEPAAAGSACTRLRDLKHREPGQGCVIESI
eukprot:SAG22_NODE_11992_length_460_cov_2.008310_1_plen_69_part_00